MKRYLPCLLLLIILGLVLSGCKTTKEHSLTKVRLNEVVHSIFYAPQYVAINQGFFEDEGIDIVLDTGWGGDKSMTALVSNNADIALIGPETTIYTRQQGATKNIVEFAQLTQCDGSFLLARNPMPDFKWEATEGKTIIGGRPGGVPEMVLEYVMKKHGVVPQTDAEVITNIQFTATAGAFKGGTGDFIALFEPTVSIMEKEGAGYVVASLGVEGGKIAYTTYKATEDYMNKNPEIIQAFVKAIYRGQQWVETHSAEEIAEAIKPSFPNDDPEIILQAVKRYKNQSSWATNPIFQKEAFENLQNVIETAGELKERVNFEDIVDNSFAEKIVK